MVRLATAGVLAGAGYLVLRVHSRQDAFRYLRSIKADLAICDLTEKEILCDICYADPEMSVLALIRKDEPSETPDRHARRSVETDDRGRSVPDVAARSPATGDPG